MPTDHRKVDSLDRRITKTLGEVDERYAAEWMAKTARIEPSPVLVKHLMDIADAYAKSAFVFSNFSVRWIKIKFWKFSIPWPNIFSERRTILQAAKMIREFAREIAKDARQIQDIASVIKADSGGCRFFSHDGVAITGLYGDDWPSDRLTAGAEIVATRYLLTHEDALQWKQDIERWIMRERHGCPIGVRERLGARKL